MKTSISTAYLIALHLLFGLVLWKSDFIPRVMAELRGKPQPWEYSDHFLDMRRYHARSAEIVPEGSVFFIGDSIIQRLCVDAVIQPAVNYGIGGDTTKGVLVRMGDYDFGRASAVVFCIGSNDLKSSKPEDVVEGLQIIISRIRPSLPVVVSSILLVDENAREILRGRNSSILRLNTLLRELSEKSPRIVFAGHDNLTLAGGLRSDLHDGDGIHPNNAGNRILAANLRAALLVACNQKEKIQGSESSPH